MEKYFKEKEYGIPHIPYLTGDDCLKQCAYFIEKSSKIVVLTGAGISTDSGIPDFRSNEEIDSKKPEDVLTLSNFKKNTKEVYDFLYSKLKSLDATANKGHLALKDIENMNKDITIITQNIDMLHRKSNMKNIIEFHGSLDNAVCLDCNKNYKIEDIVVNDRYNYICECGSLIKPNITFYEEAVRNYPLAMKSICECDLLIVIGTSMMVEPFLNLPCYISAKVPIIVINKSSTYLDYDRMSILVKDDISLSLEKIVNHIKHKTY